MKAQSLSRDEIWTHVANKVMGASAHCELWAALSDIEGHRINALHELKKCGKLTSVEPLLLQSKRAHQITLTMEVCSLYERPDKTECVTLQAYRDKVSETFAVPVGLDQRITDAYQTARKLYKLRSNYWAHGLAITSRRNLFEEAGLTSNQVIDLVAETKAIVVQLGEIEGRSNFDLHTDHDVAKRLSLVNDELLTAIATLKAGAFG